MEPILIVILVAIYSVWVILLKLQIIDLKRLVARMPGGGKKPSSRTWDLGEPV